MIKLISYTVVNGTKSAPFPLNIELEDKEELEKKRNELEEKLCYKKTLIGKKKVADIYFSYKE